MKNLTIVADYFVIEDYIPIMSGVHHMD